jgi:hypothetical protein
MRDHQADEHSDSGKGSDRRRHEQLWLHPNRANEKACTDANHDHSAPDHHEHHFGGAGGLGRRWGRRRLQPVQKFLTFGACKKLRHFRRRSQFIEELFLRFEQQL